MSAAYVTRLTEKAEGEVVLRVFQMHPDYALDPDDFLMDFGGFGVAGFAFSDADPLANRGHTSRAPRSAVRADGRLAEALDGTAPLFGVGADEVADHLAVVGVEVVRPRWSDENRDQRLREAGFAVPTDLTREVVAQIAGVLELRVSDPSGYFRDVPVDTEWTY